MKYRVVSATEAHLGAIPRVELAAEAAFSIDDLPAALRGTTLTSAADLAEACANGLLWCALLDGTVVGFAIACRLGADLHLDELDVHPDHQRRGLGRTLVEAVCRRADELRAAGVSLTTFRHPAWNRPWYLRLGFVELHEEGMPAALAAVFETEVASGLARERRVAMRWARPCPA